MLNMEIWFERERGIIESDDVKRERKKDRK